MKVFGNIIIFILLFITNARILFVRRERRDGLAMLAPVSLILTFLQISAWGIDLFSMFALVISILVIFSNFHALFRYSANLYIDHYSFSMKFWSFLTCFLSLVGLFFTIYFVPASVSGKSLGLVEKKIYFKGSFNYGFIEKDFCLTPDFVLTQVTQDLENKDNIILLIPDKRGDTEHYIPYMQALAQKGYNVFSADFYAKDCKWLHNLGDSKYFRRFAFILKSIFNEHSFTLEKEFFSFNSKKEIEEVISQLKSKYGQEISVFVISDYMANIAIKDFAKENPQNIKGYNFLDECPDYKTKGYGFITITNPLLSKYLGEEKDKEKKNLNKVVFETEKIIKNYKN